jgi:NitT/TauT family transport system ATP-binding protein
MPNRAKLQPRPVAGGAQDDNPRPKIEATDVALGYVLKKTHEFFPVSEHLELSIPEGEFVAIVGRSGCGKSTLLYAMQGLVKVDAGSLKISGTEVTGPRPDHAMVFQDASLFPWRTVWKNITYGLEVQRRATPEALDYCRNLLSVVGLQGFGDSLPHELSGGMRQRVNLARALATDPSVLLLDEPFAALDAQTRQAMQLELARIWQVTEEMSEQPKTAVFITHDIAEAVFVADRVAVMSNRPSNIKEIVTIDLPRPRNAEIKERPEFKAYVDQINALLSDESNEAELGKAVTA